MNIVKENKLREFGFYKGFLGTGLPFDCNDGWYDILLELSEGIKKLIEEGKEDKDFFVIQVKEKYGTLRYYTSSYRSEELEELIDKAEEKSAVTCELCGKPGELRDIGHWYTTMCTECYQIELIRIQELWNSVKGINTPNEQKET